MARGDDEKGRFSCRIQNKKLYLHHAPGLFRPRSCTAMPLCGQRFLKPLYVMRKDLGVKPYLFPMPVLMIATYDEEGNVDVMNMAWGGICANKLVALNLDADHKTTKNIRLRKAFTVSIADREHMREADWFGIASGNDTPDKFERTGMHAVKSNFVDAPVIEEFPVTLECELVFDSNENDGPHLYGEIKNVSADERVMTGGRVDPALLHALVFDQFRGDYYVVGERVGKAWREGKALE